MNLQKLLDGPTKIVTKFGPSNKIIRLAPGKVDPKFRAVNITYTPVTVRRTFLWPWREDQVLHSWDITATLRPRDGGLYTSTKLVRMDLEKGIEMLMLDVVSQALRGAATQIQARLAI